MGLWTHIAAVIDIDTYNTVNNIKEEVENILQNAPKITGSEGNANVFVNVLNGYSVSTNCDCNNCKYKHTIVDGEEGGFSCDGDEEFECPKGEYQTRVSITIVGGLADRTNKRVMEEYKAFLKYLKKDCDFDIINKSVKIV